MSWITDEVEETADIVMHDVEVVGGAAVGLARYGIDTVQYYLNVDNILGMIRGKDR